MKIIIMLLMALIFPQISFAQCKDINLSKKSFNDNCRAYFFVNDNKKEVEPGSEIDKRCVCFSNKINDKASEYWTDPQKVNDKCEWITTQANSLVEYFSNKKFCL